MKSNAKDIFFKIHKEPWDQKIRLEKRNSRIFFTVCSPR